MNGKVLFCLIALCLLVGVVSADTIIIYPTSDGYCKEDTDSDYATMIAAGGDSFDTGSALGYLSLPYISATTTEDLWNANQRGVFTFNTSIIGSGTINSAVFSVRSTSAKTNGLGGAYNATITGGRVADNTSIAAGDYDGNFTTELSSRIEYASWATSARNNFTLNAAGLSYIDKTGFTAIYLRDGNDALSYAPPWVSGVYSRFQIYMSENDGTSADPFFEVDYTPSAGDTTPPASITNLTGETDCNSISWSFNVPEDEEDYAGFAVWQNGTFLYNVTDPGITYEEWYGLAENTEYTISIKTFDEIGNMNETFVNETKTTDICATPTPTPTPTQVPDAGFDGYAHFNFTAWNDTPMSDWNWSVDNIYVGNSTDPFLNIWLLWGQIHNVTLFISNETDNRTISQFYNLHNITPTITPTPTPWIPDINPSTEVNYAPENLFGYWWIPAILLGLYLLFRRS